MPHDYERDGAAIYRQSFATIRAEADLAAFTPEEEVVVVRMIHAAGLVALARDVQAGVERAFGVRLVPEPVWVGMSI